MTKAIIFEDLAPLPSAGGLNPLSPLADLRAAFDVRTGALTTLERLCRSLGLQDVALLPRRDIVDVCRECHPELPIGAPWGDARPVLWINGRCILPPAEIGTLAPGEMLVESVTGGVIAARGPASAGPALLEGRHPIFRVREYSGSALLSRPWQVKSFRDRAIDADLALLAAAPGSAPPSHSVAFGDHPLVLRASAKVYPGVTFDLEAGPIVVDEGATLRPGAILHGPLYVGRGSTVLDGAIVKAHTAIGPCCKIAGEVGGTIFQGYANKAHDGHLGDSWIGEWVNLGAGTTNSNLLNTYVPVAMACLPGVPAELTGEQFLGALVGDHVKAAIGTRIMAGAVLHVGTMFASSAPATGCFEPFGWRTDRGTERYRLDKFLEVAKTVMGRRKVVPGPAYLARLAALHAAAGTR